MLGKASSMLVVTTVLSGAGCRLAGLECVVVPLRYILFWSSTVREVCVMPVGHGHCTSFLLHARPSTAKYGDGWSFVVLLGDEVVT